MKADGITKDFKQNDDKFNEYLDRKLVLTRNTYMIEMMYFAQYNNQAGIIFSLDGVHNVPDP